MSYPPFPLFCRLLGFLGLVLLIVPGRLSTASAENASPASTKAELVLFDFGDANDKQIRDAAIARFNKRYPNVKVTDQFTPITSWPDYTVSCKPEERYRFGGSAALNSYFPMPFQKKAKIVIENQNDISYGQYFYIDYELYPQPLPEPIAYFHAHWRRENPCRGWAPELQVNSPEVNVPHLDAKGNYVVLETEGTGHYVGCNLSVAHFQGSWWGEGDEMIFLDGDEWPPSLHGTGSEDYFNHAWGMQDNAFLMNGSALHESIIPGYQVSYRFHLVDPIHFSKRIAVTFEHGHANHLSDDWSSTAYWYQTLPSPVKVILPVADRLPTAPAKATIDTIDRLTHSDDQRAALEAARERFSKYKALRQEHLNRKIERTREYSRLNIEQAQTLRNRYDQQVQP